MVTIIFSLPALVVLVLVNACSSYLTLPALLEKHGVRDAKRRQLLLLVTQVLVGALVAIYTLLACAACSRSAYLAGVLVVYLLVDTAISTKMRYRYPLARLQ